MISTGREQRWTESSEDAEHSPALALLTDAVTVRATIASTHENATLVVFANPKQGQARTRSLFSPVGVRGQSGGLAQGGGGAAGAAAGARAPCPPEGRFPNLSSRWHGRNQGSRLLILLSQDTESQGRG
jgi:hypothetical protein